MERTFDEMGLRADKKFIPMVMLILPSKVRFGPVRSRTRDLSHPKRESCH